MISELKWKYFWWKIEWYQLEDNIHEVTWCFLEKQFFTSTDVSMIGYGCGVSQYPQFYNQYLDKYQVLPCPHLGSFEGYPGKKIVKKVGVRLGR